MKKKLALGIMCFIPIFAFSADAKKMYVNVENANMMEKSSAFAKIISTIKYGDCVYVLRESGKWSFIKDEKKIEGWTLTSNLTKRKVAKGSSANAKEISLAGKGFSAEAEGIYSKSGNGNYALVDKVERKTVTLNEVKNFMIEGNLIGAEE